MTVLETVNWSAVNGSTKRELQNREVHFPPVSVYRWWARRPRSLIGGLLEAGMRSVNGRRLSDPFSGGGTVALEGISRGYTVYAQDVNPWAAWGLQTALDGIDPHALRAGIDAFQSGIREDGFSEYVSACPSHGASVTTAAFSVREVRCRSCSKALFLFPYNLITSASRRTAERKGYFGCVACGSVSLATMGRTHRCSQCGHKGRDERTPLFPKRLVSCPHCDSTVSDAWKQGPRWRVVLLQRSCLSDRVLHFDLPASHERLPTRHSNVPRALSGAIPPGKELNVLRRSGFSRWADLYPPRQLRCLLRAASIATSLALSEEVRNRLLLCIAGAAEMAGRLCRWDRFHPKVFEALANHRFSPTGLAIEINPLASRGRGTIHRRMEASLRAAEWLHATKSRHSLPSGAPRIPSTASITVGSSARQPIADASVDLVITDPPYYDAVQYGELSGLFISWVSAIRGGQGYVRPLAQEAVPNPVIPGRDAHYYEQMLVSIFVETARTLAARGAVILTYHSTDFRGWAALGTALRKARLKVVAIGIARSENDKDHAKRGRHSFGHDLVVECRHSEGVDASPPVVVTRPRSSEHRELIAAGRAISEFNLSARDMAKSFTASTRRLRQQLIHVPDSLREVPDVC